MAKRKKHRKKQHNHKQNVVKNTTQPQQVKSKPKPTEIAAETPTINETKGAKTAEMADVRFSLMLVGVIVGVFVILYIALQNQSIANSVYGLVKFNF